VSLLPTPSQTAGPYVEIGMAWNASGRLVPAGSKGEVCVSGVVVDGAGSLVTDAALEFFQADPSGACAQPNGGSDPARQGNWTGFTRSLTDAKGRYVLWTVKPGRVASPAGSAGAPEAPHVNVSIFARGLLQRLVTRIYFDDEQEANAVDPVLSTIEDAATRSRLVATSTSDGYRFDIVLQGEEETPFFVP
jgi:protocatechuate 3,4-dioxygenase alpha subunit